MNSVAFFAFTLGLIATFLIVGGIGVSGKGLNVCIEAKAKGYELEQCKPEK